MRRLDRVADRLADSFALVVGAMFVLAAAAVPIILAVLSGNPWIILAAVVVVCVGAAAMAYAAIS